MYRPIFIFKGQQGLLIDNEYYNCNQIVISYQTTPQLFHCNYTFNWDFTCILAYISVVEHLNADQEVSGSNPIGISTFKFVFSILIFMMHLCLCLKKLQHQKLHHSNHLGVKGDTKNGIETKHLRIENRYGSNCLITLGSELVRGSIDCW